MSKKLINWIDYVIISCDQNPDYKNLMPYCIKRWNDLGVKVIYIDIDEDHINPDFNMVKIPMDYGYLIKLPKFNPYPKVLHRYFYITITRFIAACDPDLSKKVITISDADLFVVNKNLYLKPGINNNLIQEVTNQNKLVCLTKYCSDYTNPPELMSIDEGFYHYPNACNQIALGETWQLCLNDMFIQGVNSVMRFAEEMAWNIGRVYMNEEHYISQLYENKLDKLIVYENRIENCREAHMFTLKDHQLKNIHSWHDLCPFIEFHGIRPSYTSNQFFDKFFNLVDDFDRYDIPCPNYFYNYA